jgi:hypothetical protein
MKCSSTSFHFAASLWVAMPEFATACAHTTSAIPTNRFPPKNRKGKRPTHPPFAFLGFRLSAFRFGLSTFDFRMPIHFLHFPASHREARRKFPIPVATTTCALATGKLPSKKPKREAQPASGALTGFPLSALGFRPSIPLPLTHRSPILKNPIDSLGADLGGDL